MSNTTREIRLAARPVGEPGPEHFTLATVDLPELTDGQVLVRNTWMSVDPYMRGRMDEGESYIPPFEVGAALDGGAIGEVVASKAEAVPVGATVFHFLGWRQHAVLEASTVTVVDPALAPAQAYLGVLGTPGLTAYVSLTEIAPVRPGDVVFVSAAAGAVGSVAGQIAKQLGASRVIGSAGGPVKAKKLADFGFDAALDYRSGPIGERLAAAAPEGIDVYVDHVGGDHLEAAIGAMRSGGRIALVGAISQYNATGPVPGPNLYPAAIKQLSLRGMVVSSYLDRFPEYLGRAAGWLADGVLRTEETVFDGLERAPEAFLGVLSGVNTGKMLVRLDAR
ncbi:MULTISPECIES: NADP-dependent oxidoreductase [Saccharothrix]|uniref:NADP-dependent oxidoreductase n=1 Tax=Saccharothrix TaxID=2071 RepID=UPI000938F431|nr:NADP-dependent oxidoreductase [Saccharothrix sp. CB00851]OKI27051.1 NADP-dependent oxidoreductase [Saccharothrix sp. CB00851]